MSRSEIQPQLWVGLQTALAEKHGPAEPEYLADRMTEWGFLSGEWRTDAEQIHYGLTELAEAGKIALVSGKWIWTSVGERHGGWINTRSGKKIYPLDPLASEIRIADIAHGLGNCCRWTGQCEPFLSVGEHSVRVSLILPKELRMWGLLHDATEAYLGDMSRPLKHLSEFGRIYQQYEVNLMWVIAHKYGLGWPQPEEVTDADDVIFRAEARDIMPHMDYDVLVRNVTAHRDRIEPWAPREAKRRFLKAYREYGGTENF